MLKIKKKKYCEWHTREEILSVLFMKKKISHNFRDRLKYSDCYGKSQIADWDFSSDSSWFILLLFCYYLPSYSSLLLFFFCFFKFFISICMNCICLYPPRSLLHRNLCVQNEMRKLFILLNFHPCVVKYSTTITIYTIESY